MATRTTKRTPEPTPTPAPPVAVSVEFADQPHTPVPDMDPAEVHASPEQIAATSEIPTTHTNGQPTHAPSMQSAIEQAVQMVGALDRIREQAKSEALGQINTLLVGLRTLGFNYLLVDEAQPIPQARPQTARPSVPSMPRAPRPTITTVQAQRPSGEVLVPKRPPSSPFANYAKEKTCRYCNGMRGHDARTHRQQTTKKAFTKTELAAYGVLAKGA